MTALGVYIDNNKQHVYNFEAWLGREVDFVHAVVGYQNWTDYLSSAKWSVNTLWNGLGRDLHWSVPIISKSGDLATAATGAYNTYYRQVAETILNGTPGTEKIYIRTGWEANGNWFFWNAIGKEEAFKGAFREFVETFREVSDRFVFEWNVSQTSGGLNPATIYPGDEWVDIIGMDFYYKPEYHGTDPVKAFNYIRDDVYGLQWLENFAKAHGKPTSYSEWGVQGNNAAEFVKLAEQWFESHNVILQSYWDSNADYPGKLSDNSDPATGAAFKDAFSGPTTVELPGSSTTPIVTVPTTPTTPDTTAPSVPVTDGTMATASGAWSNQSWGNSATKNWTGGSGNDWHQSSGGGSDTMKGGKGDDTYVISSANDKVIELAGEGVDTVSTWISAYTLPDHVENLTFFGNGWSNGTGNALANIIIGTSSPNVLNGKGGNDILTGGAGKDTFVVAKGEGTDIITDFKGGEDILKLDGFSFTSFTALKAAGTQSGSHTVLNLGNGQTVTLQNFTLSGLTSSDVSTIYSGSANTTPTAPVVTTPPVVVTPPATTTPTTSTATASGAWSNQSWGNSATKNWTGGSGNDWRQSSGGGSDIMKGGKGDDTYFISGANDQVIELAGEGVDTVSTWIGAYTLPDHVENLTFFGYGWSNGTGNALANIIIGNDGPNVLNGKGGNDILTGGAGNDTFVVAKGEGGDIVTDFKSGEDILKLDGFSFTSFTALKAAAAQSGSHTVLNLGDGQTVTLQNFKLSGLTSSDVSTTYGGSSASTPVVTAPVVTAPVVTAPAHLDSTATASGAWSKQSWGSSAKESWTGTTGNDWYQSGGGGDTMKGGKGADTYQISAAGDKVVELAGEGVDTVSTWISDYTLPDHVENLIFFGNGWCNGTGNALDNIIIGTSSPNVLNGKGGNDILTGGAGNDTFIIAKGDGNDTITDFAVHKSGSANGDKLLLQGFGQGATLSHVGDVWTVHAADGRAQYITISGVTALSASDYAFS